MGSGPAEGAGAREYAWDNGRMVVHPDVGLAAPKGLAPPGRLLCTEPLATAAVRQTPSSNRSRRQNETPKNGAPLKIGGNAGDRPVYSPSVFPPIILHRPCMSRHSDVLLGGRQRARLRAARENGYLNARCAAHQLLVQAFSLWCWRLRIPMVWLEYRTPRSRYGRVHLD